MKSFFSLTLGIIVIGNMNFALASSSYFTLSSSIGVASEPFAFVRYYVEPSALPFTFSKEKKEIMLKLEEEVENSLSNKKKAEDVKAVTAVQCAEESFFGNQKLYKEFLKWRESIAEGKVSGEEQVLLSWLVQNVVGNRDKVKWLLNHYYLQYKKNKENKEAGMFFLFWRNVARYYRLAIGDKERVLIEAK